MNIDIFAKNITLDAPLRLFIEEKIGSLEHFIKNAGEVQVRVEIGKPSHHHRTGPFFYAEANMKIAGEILRAQAEHGDLYMAITEVKDELQIQIKKFKDKNSSH
jgi:putative sigma-54 modulation protein